MTSLDFPETMEIPGPSCAIPIRVLRPEQVDGVYLHFHGGGMTLGSAAGMDGRNWPLAQACNVAVVSVDYRLAPEDPFPAGPDDCEAAALWLVDHCREQFGTSKLLVGGESAGAYLAILTMLRLRQRLGGPPPFLGVDLCYGWYDLGGTPSTIQQIGKVPYASGDGANRRHYLPGRSRDEAATRPFLRCGLISKACRLASSRSEPPIGFSTIRCSSQLAWARPVTRSSWRSTPKVLMASRALPRRWAASPASGSMRSCGPISMRWSEPHGRRASAIARPD